MDQVQSLFGLYQHCESLIVSLSAFGGVTSFVKEKFRDGIDIFIKVEFCYILTYMQISQWLKNGICFKS